MSMSMSMSMCSRSNTPGGAGGRRRHRRRHRSRRRSRGRGPRPLAGEAHKGGGRNRLSLGAPGLGVPAPGGNLGELFLPLWGHGRRLVAVLPSLALGPFRQGPVVLGGDLAGPVFGGVLHQQVVLVVPGALEAVPDKAEVVEAADLRFGEFLVLEVVPLALDPAAELLVGIAAEDVGVSVFLVESEQAEVVLLPGLFDDAGVFFDDRVVGQLLGVLFELVLEFFTEGLVGGDGDGDGKGFLAMVAVVVVVVVVVFVDDVFVFVDDVCEEGGCRLGVCQKVCSRGSRSCYIPFWFG
mmetsp:Transcript_17624/g.48744  ORF Transcript_17624/g.48744 Transcript_17624/m.48744 type:complete len:295 (-) Transcript_17624:732-1616(-)